MKKIVSFSLWGILPKYNIGAIKNADLAFQYYPEFEYWFYIHVETVPDNIIKQLEAKSNVKIILKTGNLKICKPMMWRFEAIDDPDVEIMICRDTDSRISLREKIAVDEWIESKKIFHIMRDHPYHTDKILAGMFGTRKIPKIPEWKKLIDNCNGNSSYGCDQTFLATYIYPHIKKPNISIIHASFNKHEKHAKSFVLPFNNDYNFVGEIILENESRCKEHIDLLKKRL